MSSSVDERWMWHALGLAAVAAELGEVPVGAVLVRGEEIVAEGLNCPIGESDPTAHAEIRALRAAGRAAGNYRFLDTTLYVTMEPCPMCAGALVHARVSRLVFGAPDTRAGAAGTVFDIVRAPQLNHRLEVTSGILEDECRDVLQAFFRARRG
ncbi:MAG: tRNA adenosine(34) deaminase TadA [Gammaproteobacteria bacterium]|nr:tRNA adenosine(34) deaminase TadA [Gammaproteobacteria bacterium]